jgi:hypothetical protein
MEGFIGEVEPNARLPKNLFGGQATSTDSERKKLCCLNKSELSKRLTKTEYNI